MRMRSAARDKPKLVWETKRGLAGPRLGHLRALQHTCFSVAFLAPVTASLPGPLRASASTHAYRSKGSCVRAENLIKRYA
jgi:hypothetical protein